MEQRPEQHSVFVKEEPREESQIPVFCYEAVTKEEVIFKDELAENEPSDDECSNDAPADVPPVDGNQFKHFKCPVCNKLFMRKKFANTCEKKHETIRLGLFECKLCNKRFSKKQHLADHMESHKRGTIKMFVCNICSKRFCSKQLFEKHEKVQSCGDQKKFGCQICKKNFVSQANLDRHMISHTNETNALPPRTNIPSAEVTVDNRIYKCPECSKKFDRVTLVRGCIRKHEARELGYFKCRFCLVCLGTFQYLKKHEARHRLEQKTNNGQPDLPKDEQTFPPIINEDEDEAEDFNGEPEAESKQFYIIEEIPESAVVKEELPNLPIKTEPDIEQCIPHTVVGGKPQVKKELIISS